MTTILSGETKGNGHVLFCWKNICCGRLKSVGIKLSHKFVWSSDGKEISFTSVERKQEKENVTRGKRNFFDLGGDSVPCSITSTSWRNFSCDVCIYADLDFLVVMFLFKCVPTDKDECVEGIHTCDSICVNTVGGYECSCPLNTVWDGINACFGKLVNLYIRVRLFKGWITLSTG